MVPKVQVRSVENGDKEQWKNLFRGYREFYELEPSEEVVSRVWEWITDTSHEVEGLVAVDDGKLVGIAHYRRFSRPSTGTEAIWLDDLFTLPEARGRGVARAMIYEVGRRAKSEKKNLVRWITADDNKAAQVLYDSLATKTNWLVYDLKQTI